MLTESPSGLNRAVTSLKVAAVVAILGSVVLAAERHKGTEILPEPAAAAQTAPASQQNPGSGAQDAAAVYFPAHFPAPSGPAAELPPTF
jgi:hypothetical protein